MVKQLVKLGLISADLRNILVGPESVDGKECHMKSG